MLDSTNPYARISKKWIGFVTAIWIQSIAGNNYTFANYSPALKEVLHYNQLQLNNLGVAKDVGKSFGLFAGLLADHLPTWAILLIGALEGAIGYGTQYLVVGQKIGPPSYWQVGTNLAESGLEGLGLFSFFTLLVVFLTSLFFSSYMINFGLETSYGISSLQHTYNIIAEYHSSLCTNVLEVL